MIPIVKTGEILLFTAGEYSDYDVKEVAVASVDFDFEAEIKQYLDAHPNREEGYNFRPSWMILWLEKRKMVHSVPYRELYLGDYREPTPSEIEWKDVVRVRDRKEELADE